MAKKVFIAFILLFFFVLTTTPTLARSGCCSHHGGVCGCGCCDGSALSDTCAPYYPECSSGSSNSAPASNTTAPVYVAPTSTPIPPTATPIPPTNIPSPTAKPTVIPTKKPVNAQIPTVVPTAAVLGASAKTSSSDIWIGLIAFVVLLGLFAGFCFLTYKLSKRLIRKFNKRFPKVGKPIAALVAKQSKIITLTPSDWVSKCPVCGSPKKLDGTTTTHLWGLLKTTKYICSSCQATFKEWGDNYELLKIADDKAQKPAWVDYQGQVLTTREWNNIANGGMSDAKQKEADMETFVGKLKDGFIPDIPFGVASNILLQKEEKVIVAFPGIGLHEPRAVRTGGSRGVSVRVAKGLYYRVGAFKSMSHEEIQTIDRGTLTITSKRLIFEGSTKNITVDLKKIVSVQPYSDGIELIRATSQKPSYFVGLDNATITVTIQGRSYQEPFSGLFLVYLIEGLSKKLE